MHPFKPLTDDLAGVESRLHHTLKTGEWDSMQVKDCNGCQLCCIAPSIDMLSLSPKEHLLTKVGGKPAGTKCQHCTNTGCGVYRKRPEVCRGYMCLHITGLVMRNPKDSGICWTYQPDYSTMTTLIVGHTLDADSVLADVDTRAEIAALLALKGILRPSAVVVRGTRQMIRFTAEEGQRALMVDTLASDPMHTTPDPTTERYAPHSLRRAIAKFSEQFSCKANHTS